MFCYQEKVNAGVPKVCTPEIWDSLVDSPAVANTCAAIAALDPNAADYADRKQALKKRLPIIIPHAASFKNGKRISANAIPCGLAMLDVDHVDNARDWFDSIDKLEVTEAQWRKMQAAVGLKAIRQRKQYPDEHDEIHAVGCTWTRRFRTGASQPCGDKGKYNADKSANVPPRHLFPCRIKEDLSLNH